MLGARSDGLDLDAVLPAARELLSDAGALTFDEIRGALQERFPDVNDRALGYAVRTLLALVMVPGEDDARWGFPRVASFTLAEDWLDEPLASEEEAPSRRSCAATSARSAPRARRTPSAGRRSAG